MRLTNWVRCAAALPCFAFAAFQGGPSQAEDPPPFTIEATVRGQTLQGRPLAWDDHNVFLLARDGRLWQFRPEEAAEYRQTATDFTGLSAAELQAALRREFARDLEVTATEHYLVAHPPGGGRAWAQRFEDLYRTFRREMTVRGFQPLQPPYPLVAIAWDRREDFLRYAAAENAQVTDGVLGYYSPITNRVAMYDLGEAEENGDAWRSNAAVIMHEATHQTAFNLGLHNRFIEMPKWLVEGLGALFEAPGIRDLTRMRERVNKLRLQDYKALSPGETANCLASMIEGDHLFARDPQTAYALSWATTYYLWEREPRKYCELLAAVAGRPIFREYSAAQRKADFDRIFGVDVRLLDLRVRQFVEGLR